MSGLLSLPRSRLHAQPAKMALFVHIGYYHSSDDPFAGIALDTSRMSELLIGTFGYAKENITVLRDMNLDLNSITDDVRSSWPTRENILRAMADLAATCMPGDHLVCHLSGRGERIDHFAGTSQSYSETESPTETTLVSAFWTASEGTYRDFNQPEWITGKDIQNSLLEHMRSQVKLVMILDFDHAGNFLGLPHTIDVWGRVTLIKNHVESKQDLQGLVDVNAVSEKVLDVEVSSETTVSLPTVICWSASGCSEDVYGSYESGGLLTSVSSNLVIDAVLRLLSRIQVLTSSKFAGRYATPTHEEFLNHWASAARKDNFNVQTPRLCSTLPITELFDKPFHWAFTGENPGRDTYDMAARYRTKKIVGDVLQSSSLLPLPATIGIPVEVFGNIMDFIVDPYELSGRIRSDNRCLLSPFLNRAARRQEIHVSAAYSLICRYTARLIRPRIFEALILRSAKDVQELQTFVYTCCQDGVSPTLEPICKYLSQVTVLCELNGYPWFFNLPGLLRPTLHPVLIFLHINGWMPNVNLRDRARQRHTQHPLFAAVPRPVHHVFPGPRNIHIYLENIHFATYTGLHNLAQDLAILGSRINTITCDGLTWDDQCVPTQVLPLSPPAVIYDDISPSRMMYDGSGSMKLITATGCTDDVLAMLTVYHGCTKSRLRWRSERLHTSLYLRAEDQLHLYNIIHILFKTVVQTYLARPLVCFRSGAVGDSEHSGQLAWHFSGGRRKGMPAVDAEVIKFGCIVRPSFRDQRSNKFGIGHIYKLVIDLELEDPDVEVSALNIYDSCWGPLMQAVRKLKGLEAIDVWGHTRDQLARFVQKLDRSLRTSRALFRFHWLEGDRLREGILNQDWQLTDKY